MPRILRSGFVLAMMIFIAGCAAKKPATDWDSYRYRDFDSDYVAPAVPSCVDDAPNC